MLSRIRFEEYVDGGPRQPTILKMMISLFMLLAQLDPTIAVSVRRSLNPYHPNLDSEPYGIIPPTYPYDPHPLSIPESVVHSPRPIICNNETEYECICMRPFSSEHAPNKFTPTSPDCSVFIKTDDLPVVDMRMRQVNTEAKLYTGDSYEAYFKRRISTIVSHYCQHNTNECPGVSLRMSHVSQDNVVILRMDHIRGNLTRLLFILTKNDRNNGVINEETIIDPIKIKYIIASQVGPLSRVLGGIKIDSVRTAKLKRNSGAFGSMSYSTPEQRRENQKDNTKLIIIVVIIGLFFLGTYCIGLYQCIRWYKKKRRATKEAKLAEQSLVAADTKNYGTCEIKQRKPSRNGHMVHAEERIPLTYEQIDEFPDDKSQSLPQRQMRNWFKCDASQLPREPTYPTSLVESQQNQNQPGASTKTPNPTDDFKMKEESPILTKRKEEYEMNKPASPMLSSQATTSSEAAFPPSKDFSDYVEGQYHKSRASSNSPTDELSKSPQEDPWDEMNGKYVPPMVLLQSDTPDLPFTIQNHLGKQKYEGDEEEDVALKGLRSGESPAFARPRSRRGSRIDEIEGQLDIPELKPLRTDDPLAEPLDAPVPINSIKGSVDEEDRWSSSEEGEVDVYYKMSDDEDVTREELDWKKAMAKAELEKEAESQGRTLPGGSESAVDISKKKTETPPSSPIQIHIQNHLNHNNASDSEEEDEPIPEEAKDAEIAEKDDDFVYERLREELSPQPPIVVDLDTDLDLVPMKSLPPPPPGMFPDSPPESGSSSHQMHHQRSQDMSEEEDEDDLR